MATKKRARRKKPAPAIRWESRLWLYESKKIQDLEDRVNRSLSRVDGIIVEHYSLEAMTRPGDYDLTFFASVVVKIPLL